MPGFREYAVSPSVLEQARAIGMYGNVEGRIKRMAQAAVPFKHPPASHRFDSYLFRIEGDTVVMIMKFDPSKPMPRKRQ